MFVLKVYFKLVLFPSVEVRDELGHIIVDSSGKSNSILCHYDITNEEHIKDEVYKIVLYFGRIDTMINNTGTSYPS